MTSPVPQISISLACGIAGLVLVLISTFSSLYLVASTAFKSKQPNSEKIYQDEDGVATEESIAKYSTTRTKIVICVLSLLGLGISIALAVLGTLNLSNDGFLIQDWLNAASWVFLPLNTGFVMKHSY